MIAPVGSGVSGQASSDGLLQCPDGAFGLSVGLAVTNGYLMVLNPKGLTQAVQASLELGSIVCPDKSRLPPVSDDPLV